MGSRLQRIDWRRHGVSMGIGLLLVVAMLGHAVYLYRPAWLNQLEAIAYDARLRATLPGGIDERIVIVDIDEKSLAEVGRWPWGRDRMARLVDNLFDHYQARMLGMDVVFAEPDDSSGLKILDQLATTSLRQVSAYQEVLESLRLKLDHDEQFARALQNRPIVLGYYFSDEAGVKAGGRLPSPVLPARASAGKEVGVIRWAGYGSNLDRFMTAARGAGHFNPLVDFDGMSRRVPLLVEHKEGYYEALSLAMVRLLRGGLPLRLDAPESILGTSYRNVEWLTLTGKDGLRVPVDENLAALIPYRGPQGSFRYVSASDVLSKRLPADVLKDRIVLLGTTAPGLLDLRATPVGSTYPGVEIHANLIAGMLDGNLRHKPAFVMGIEVVWVLACGLSLALLLPLLSPLQGTLVVALLSGGTIALNLVMWSSGLVVPLSGVLLLIAMQWIYNMAWGYFVEARSKRQFADLFGQYVPPELVEEMSRDPQRYSMDGCSEDLTVLFSDVRNFTTISEGLEPKALANLINGYLSAMTGVIRQHRGTLDKYIGDAIMAFWGAPVPDAEHAERAVAAALAMQERMVVLGQEFEQRGWPVLTIGIGINSGVMTVGDMGSDVRKAYTVMGDAVNLGSRLEGLTKQYGVGILAGETTRAAVEGYVWREIDRVRVKGKAEPVAIYEPIGREGSVEKAFLDEIKLWQQTLRLYRAQDWDQAELQLMNLSRLSGGHRLYAMYADRVQKLRQAPPGEGWDGVTTFETK